MAATRFIARIAVVIGSRTGTSESTTIFPAQFMRRIGPRDAKSFSCRGASEIFAKAWKTGSIFCIAAPVFTLFAFAQDIPTFRVETKEALVWDESVQSTSTSTIWDPRTGIESHKLSYDDIEVSSLLGYERVSPTKEGRLITFITTIANNTNSDISVKYGGTTIDDHIVLPLSLVPTGKKVKKRIQNDAWELGKMHCFKSGFASENLLFSAPKAPQTFLVHPQTVTTVSFVTADPRSSSILCSSSGCHMTGTVRYYITVNLRDYVFVWRGRSIAYCGE